MWSVMPWSPAVYGRIWVEARRAAALKPAIRQTTAPTKR